MDVASKSNQDDDPSQLARLQDPLNRQASRSLQGLGKKVGRVLHAHGCLHASTHTHMRTHTHAHTHTHTSTQMDKSWPVLQGVRLTPLDTHVRTHTYACAYTHAEGPQQLFRHTAPPGMHSSAAAARPCHFRGPLSASATAAAAQPRG